MRKIEKLMVQAVESGRAWQNTNTSVLNTLNGVGVFLYGNRIAYTDNSGRLQVDITTLRQYPTVTTKSRLRALGFDVYTSKGVTYLNDKEVL